MPYLPDNYDFDANKVDPQTPYEAIPAGDYKLRVIETEIKPTRAGDGQYLQLTCEIIEGEYEKRRLWDRLNLVNPSEQAVRIARSQLSALCHATGVMVPNPTEKLHNIPFIAKVTYKTDPQRGPQNEIKGYLAVDEAAQVSGVAQPQQVAQPPQQQPQQPQPQPATSQAPWLKGAQ